MPGKLILVPLFAAFVAAAAVIGTTSSLAQIQDPLGLGSLGINESGEGEGSEKGIAGASELDPTQDEFLKLSIQEQVLRNSKNRMADVRPEDMGSVFFTFYQYITLQDMKKQAKEDPLPAAGQEEVRQPGIRELALGGIAFVSASDWTIWLNGQRVKPDAIPENVLDLSVSNEYIELKWFDAYTNLIFPVRLRPHQRFNLDSRIFLPGEGIN